MTDEVRQKSAWTTVFADCIMICSKSREQMDESLERWRYTLKRRGISQ